MRKSPRELAGELRARRLTGAIGVASILLLLVGAWLPNSVLHIAIVARLGAVVAACIIIVAWRRRAYWRTLQSSVWICEDCNAVKAGEKHAPCACGGTLVSLSEMKWLEFPPIQKNRIPAPPAVKKDFPGVHAAHAG